MAKKPQSNMKKSLFRVIMSIIIIGISLLYALLWQPRLREQNRKFILQRSAETLKTFGTLSLIKGSIEVAKQIPAIKTLASRAEPAEELVDMLWRFSLFSFIWHQVLAIYIDTDWLFQMPLALVLLYLLAVYLPLSIFQSSSQPYAPFLNLSIFLRSHARILYLLALFLAVLLPLYILISSGFYRYYEQEYILPHYQALTETFMPVKALADQNKTQKADTLQIQEDMADQIAQNQAKAQTIQKEIEALDQKIAQLKKKSGWWLWLFRKSQKQQELVDLRRKLSKESRQILDTMARQNRELSRSQGKGLGGLWDSAKNYLGDAKGYIQAYSQSFQRLISAEGQQNLRSYVFHKLTLAVCYFFVFPALLLLCLRTIFPHTQQISEQTMARVIQTELRLLQKDKKQKNI